MLLALLSFIAGILTRDYCWTDRLWSIAPVGLAWIYALASGWDTRLLVAALLISLWGLRLTFNFARQGGYFGKEDYRWAILRKKISNGALWQLFNLLFIAGTLLHWSIIGPVLLTCLFVVSTRFTETISAAKYPEYTDYQKTTWPIVPRPW